MEIINKKVKVIGASIVALVVLALGGLTWYQHTHFNSQVTINGTKVGGLTADATLKKLRSVSLTNAIYLDGKLFYQGQKTAAGFTASDLGAVKKVLKKQVTLFPTKAAKDYEIAPSKISNYRKVTLKQELKAKLESENLKRTKAQDAYAILKDGKVSVVPAKKGNQYDVAKILKEYDRISYSSDLNLRVQYLQPLSAKSQEVKTEQTKLAELAGRKVDYQVQDKHYELKANEMLTSARYVDGKYQFDTAALKNKVNEINQAQATLGKTFTFTTSTGKTIQVPGKTYGWALRDSDAIASITKAYETGKTSLNAVNDIYGTGYLTYGTGYDTTLNGGLGNTYAEVSIADQHVWLYKNGQQVASIDVVTGKKSTGEDTPTGVWYIMYKQSPSVLRGSSAGSGSYEVKVNYWAQFTNSGCGFHDASWRKNWAKDAYISDGSGGCVNVKPSEMPNIYNNLSQKEAVIIY